MEKYLSTFSIYLKFSERMHVYKMNLCVNFDEKRLSMRKVIAFNKNKSLNTNFLGKCIARDTQ